MRKIGIKPKLIIIALLSALVLLCGVVSLAPTSFKAESNGNTYTVQSDWYEINYDKDSLEVRLSNNFREYLDMNKEEASNLVHGLVSALKLIAMDSLLFENELSHAVAAQTSNEEDFWSEEGLSERLKAFKDYVEKRLKDPDELDKFLSGGYDPLLEYAIGTYIESQNDGDMSDEELDAIYDKIQNAIKEVVEDVLPEAAARAAKIELGEGATKEQIDEFVNNYIEEREGKAQEVLSKNADVIKNNAHKKPSIDLNDIVDALEAVKINGIEVFSFANGISVDGLRYALSLIPRPSQIANMGQEELRNLVSATIMLDTTFGEVGFKFTFGFFGESTIIQKAAKFAADHLDVSLDGHDLSITARVPDEFSEIFLKFTQTSQISDELKNKIFSLFGKTTSEIVDKAESYTYEELLELLKSVNYEKWFNNFLNSDFILSYFNVYFEQATGHTVSMETVDKVIDKLASVAQSIAYRQWTYDEVYDFLNRNIPGFSQIASRLESSKLKAVVNKLLGFVNRIDWSMYDAEGIRDMLATPGLINGKIVSLIEKLDGYGNYYEKFIEYADRLFGYLPDNVKEDSLFDMYDGNNEFSHNGTYTIDIQRIFFSK